MPVIHILYCITGRVLLVVYRRIPVTIICKDENFCYNYLSIPLYRRISVTLSANRKISVTIQYLSIAEFLSQTSVNGRISFIIQYLSIAVFLSQLSVNGRISVIIQYLSIIAEFLSQFNICL